MSRLNLPGNTDAGFRFEFWDAFENRFTVNIYGARRRGWFLAPNKWHGNAQAVGPQPLARGQWREFLGLIKQAGFWDLPARIPIDPNINVEDGSWLLLIGRSGEHHHEIYRDGYDNGLLQVTRFLRRLSGFFPIRPTVINPEPLPALPQDPIAS